MSPSRLSPIERMHAELLGAHGSVLGPGMEAPGIDIRYVRPGYIPGVRRRDVTAKMEMTVGGAVPTSLRARIHTLRAGGIRRTADTFTTAGESLTSSYTHALAGLRDAGHARGITFAWDTPVLERVGMASGISGGGTISGAALSGGRAPLIGVRNLIREVFPQLHFSNSTTLENMARAMGLSIAGLGDQGAGVPQLLEEMVGRAFAKDALAVRRHLARQGVEGLQNLTVPVLRAGDPHNIDRYMGTINQPIPKGISKRGAARSYHIAGPGQLDHFTQRLTQYFGRDYSDIFRSFATDVLERVSSPGDVAFLLTKGEEGARRLFVGLAGVSGAYHELPIEHKRLGIFTQGGKTYSVRGMLGVKHGMSPARMYFDQFFKGMGEFGGGFSNLYAALEKGGIEAGRAGVYGQGMRWPDMKTSLHSLGEVSIHSALWDTRTVIGPKRHWGAGAHDAALAQGFGGAAARENIGGLEQRMAAGMRGDIAAVEGLSVQGIDVSLYHAVKQQKKIGGKIVLPRRPLGEAFIPGSLTARHLMKGTYQMRGRAEITQRRAIAKIRWSRAAAGLGGPAPIAVTPFARAIERATKKFWSRRLGRPIAPLIEMNALVGVIGSGGSPLAAKMLGDSGAFKTARGEYMLQRSVPTVGTSAEITSRQLESAMEIMSVGAQRKGGKGWSDVIRKASAGQHVQLDEGLAISRAARHQLAGLGKGFSGMVPRGAEILKSVGFNEASGKFEFRWATGQQISPVDALLIGNQRVAARSASRGYLLREFGRLGGISDFIMNADTFVTQGVENIQFTHMLGLAGTRAGVKRGGPARFVDLYKEATLGKEAPQLHLHQSPHGQRISWKRGTWKSKDWGVFRAGAEQALKDMGFSEGMIYGLAETTRIIEPGERMIKKRLFTSGDLLTENVQRGMLDIPEFESSAHATQALAVQGGGQRGRAGELLSRPSLTRAEFEAIKSGDLSRGIFAFISSMSRRAADVADTLSQEKSFRMSLETMHLISSGMAEMVAGMPISSGRTTGVAGRDAMKHPIFSRLAEHYAKTTGVTLSPGSSPGRFAVAPGEVKRLAAALTYRGKAVTGGQATYQGAEVLTRAEAARRFIYDSEGGINVTQLRRRGISKQEILAKKLLSLEKGVFVDMGDNYNIPTSLANARQMEKGTIPSGRARSFYIPSAKAFRQIIGAEAGEGILQARHGLLMSMVELLEQPTAAAGELGPGAKITPAQAFFNIWKHIVRGTAKGGFFGETMLKSTKLPGSISGRLIQKEISSQVASAMTIGEEMFTVRVSSGVIEDMARTLARESSRDVSVIRKELFGRAREGKLFGGVTPRPQHGASHLPVVRIKVENFGRADIVGTEHVVATDSYFAWRLDRDFDKDKLEVFAMEEAHYKGTVHPADIIQKQFAEASREYPGWVKAVAHGGRVEQGISEILRGSTGEINLNAMQKYALPYFGFGRTPALPFIGSYSAIAFGSILADKSLKTPEGIIAHLKRISGHLMSSTGAGELTEANVRKYQMLLGQAQEGNMTRAVALAIELHRPAYQAAITKGGQQLGSLVDDFLNIPYEVSQIYQSATDEQVVAKAIENARVWITNMVSGGGPLGDDVAAYDVLSKIKGKITTYKGTPQEMVATMADDMGRLYAVAALAQARHYREKRSVPHVIHQGLNKTYGDINAFALFADEHTRGLQQAVEIASAGLDVEVAAELDAADELRVAESAERNASRAAEKLKGSQVLRDIGAKLKGNWAAIAGVGAALIVARQLAGSTAVQAPLGKQPMVDFSEPGPVMNLTPPQVSLMPNFGGSSMLTAKARMAGGMIEGMVPSRLLGSMGRQNSFSTLNIQDSRQYMSNWQASKLAQAQGNTDFIHPHQYNG